MKRLKGPKGSEVKLGVFRPGEKETLHFTIVRGDIPVKSVDTAYMLNDKFGYIKVNKFGETTYPELLISLAKLNQANCEGVVIDLRGNTGGYMGAAIQMVNEFLPKTDSSFIHRDVSLHVRTIHPTEPEVARKCLLSY